MNGLRTLVFAQRFLTNEIFDQWAEKEWNVSRLATENRREMLVNAAELIETDLEVIGTSGIEDRLQDAVPETIADLLKANIKVWVLTGDKGQTAINIAEACCLIKPEQHLIRIKAEVKEELDSVQQLIYEGISTAEKEECALVIDGKAFAHALENELGDEVAKLGGLCKAVVCCRSTPIQKEQMVQLIKSKLPVRTLAIGDGANDVPMIQKAHVGVGVKGNEGMQAVMSSDFVIGQFRFLRRLLLLHGRWNYQRCGFMVCYLIYKNLLLTLLPFWFAFYSQWSGEVWFFLLLSVKNQKPKTKTQIHKKKRMNNLSITGLFGCMDSDIVEFGFYGCFNRYI
jgi:phospholipid-transporting ATPase